jgi:hypothetical protein
VFGSVVVVAFQTIFRAKIHANDIFSNKKQRKSISADIIS